MLINKIHLKGLLLLITCLALTESTKMASNTTLMNSTINVNMTTKRTVTSIPSMKKPLYIQGQEFFHDHFYKLNRTAVLWSTVGLATITSLLLIYLIIQTLISRRKRQTRRYKLLSHATTMQEPLFNEHDDDDEDERDNDTLFVRR